MCCGKGQHIPLCETGEDGYRRALAFERIRVGKQLINQEHGWHVPSHLFDHGVDASGLVVVAALAFRKAVSLHNGRQDPEPLSPVPFCERVARALCDQHIDGENDAHGRKSGCEVTEQRYQRGGIGVTLLATSREHERNPFSVVDVVHKPANRRRSFCD